MVFQTDGYGLAFYDDDQLRLWDVGGQAIKLIQVRLPLPLEVGHHLLPQPLEFEVPSHGLFLVLAQAEDLRLDLAVGSGVLAEVPAEGSIPSGG